MSNEERYTTPDQPTVARPAPPPPPPPGQYVPPPASPTSPESSNSGLVITISVLSLILVAFIVAGAFLLGRGDGDPEAIDTTTSSPQTTTTTTTTTTSTTVVPATSVATTVAPVTAPPGGGPVGDVLAQPSGLYCRDLEARGFGYAAAVDYWIGNGQPERMDVDRDGIPCETVYSESSVLGYWGTLGRTVVIDEQDSTAGFSSGLRCADLRDRGANTRTAIEYYLYWGRPTIMDADKDGIPCETVYDDAESLWFGVYGAG